MAITPLHKAKLRKNLAVLAMIVGFMALIWAITILKIQQYGVGGQ
jgi:hypothetical protein